MESIEFTWIERHKGREMKMLRNKVLLECDEDERGKKEDEDEKKERKKDKGKRLLI